MEVVDSYLQMEFKDKSHVKPIQHEKRWEALEKLKRSWATLDEQRAKQKQLESKALKEAEALQNENAVKDNEKETRKIQEEKELKRKEAGLTVTLKRTEALMQEEALNNHEDRGNTLSRSLLRPKSLVKMNTARRGELRRSTKTQSGRVKSVKTETTASDYFDLKLYCSECNMTYNPSDCKEESVKGSKGKVHFCPRDHRCEYDI